MRNSTMVLKFLPCFIIPTNEWFDTGDLCSIDAEGFVYIAGRTKDMIKVQAWQVNPYEIEEVIKENVPGVDDCVVIGVPDETDGQRPKAFVVGQADPNDVIEFVRDTFISYKHLCAVEIVDAIPRSPSGKIMRVVLAEQQDSPFVD
ncbi:hypothetical protein KIN20_023553 [Parelaphostrongylus tenuis]|uniref:AMP-binding enzyme C-terminal domain-containing protein n=1 Tax=Parelaphostrongylus tenuis TaxID=148309 RepID=A0AAD5MVS3_PARTN|nr:hypothetical protein KIN20_023553 [Parelaphostrongylus tenuis]